MTAAMARSPRDLADEDDWSKHRLLIEHLLEQLQDRQNNLHTEIESLRNERLEGVFSPQEMTAIRAIVRDWERYRWAWAVAGRVSAYIAGFVIAVYGAREIFPKLWQALKVLWS